MKEPTRTILGAQFESPRGLQAEYARYMEATAQKVRPDDEEPAPDLTDWSGEGVEPVDPNAPVDTSNPTDWSPTGEGQK